MSSSSSSSDSNAATSCCNIFNFTKKDLLKSGFYHTKLFDNIVCCGCGWQTCNAKLTLKQINFIHKVQNPLCKMSKYIDVDVNKYIDCTNYVNEIKKNMKETYVNWVKENKPSVDDLIESGFYYTGQDDATTCVSCGITLDEWQESDEPIVEHEKVNPNCELLCISSIK